MQSDAVQPCHWHGNDQHYPIFEFCPPAGKSQRPEMGIIDTLTGEQWVDKQGLGWTNPYNQTVWVYNIALARELAELGFDEIQFDYIRFPSDGDLSHIRYPLKPGQLSKTQCIGKFLESAYGSLHPLGSPSRWIYIDWQNNCRFTQSIPQERLRSYRTAGEVVFATDHKVLAGVPQKPVAN
jgi:hypothetical protein